MTTVCKLYDFEEYDEKEDIILDNGKKKWGDTKQLKVRMFGMNEKGETFSIIVENFQPYIYVKVPENWGKAEKMTFFNHIKNLDEMKYYKNSISECKLVLRKKLYTFDCGQKYKFILFKFKNKSVLNKVKNLWYTDHPDFTKRKLKRGYEYMGENLRLYEAKLPSLLRMFHVTEISPSGWINIKNYQMIRSNETSCTYEYKVSYKDLIPMPEKEDPIPLKVMSWDIEASSSHGDFPLAIKNYKKLITEVVHYWTNKNNKDDIKVLDKADQIDLFKRLIFAGFGFGEVGGISRIFPKKKITKLYLTSKLDALLLNSKLTMSKLIFIDKTYENDEFTIGKPIQDQIKEKKSKIYWKLPKPCKSYNFISCLNYNFDKSDKIDVLTWVFGRLTNGMIRDIKTGKYKLSEARYCNFPQIKGDRVTFIGSTFMKIGEKDQYLNHMAVVGECSDIPEVPNRKIDQYKTEKAMIVGWSKLIRKEDPDVIIGYNTFGFDWAFMIDRAIERQCLDQLLTMSKIHNKKARMQNTSTTVASGTYELRYAKIQGRVQLDLYNHFRKNVNLSSYKLDNVASVFIGDIIKEYTYNESVDTTTIKSENLFGLKNGHYISFELIGHSSDMYNDGQKFSIFDLKDGEFKVKGQLIINQEYSKLRWCLNKDDITLEEMFNANSPDKRAKVAKYCYQDCNLVHSLMNKNDIWTEMSELASLCSVPIHFVIIRGQGIKLLSYIAKECRKEKTVMPVMEKDENDKAGYEGAICLAPKCGFYADNPVAVNDYSSLYPSCMISENISHDSKVWSKEYDLDGNLIPEKTTGIRDISGRFIYDNLPEYGYVDISFDTFEYRRLKGLKSAEEKVKTGTKTCRFAQFPDGKKAIMPSVLSKLLQSRKDTKKLMKKAKDPFMKNVYDKRQLSKKVVANSLYGQCGSKTSSFYEKDIAASTTAMGRKMLFYAKRIVEECYGNRVVDTKYGKMRTRAEYIYGDTDSVFFTFNLEDLDGNKIKGKKALEITIDLSIEVERIASDFIKPPHYLEYEKTFMPFLLLSKKRYVGILYEHDPNKGKRKEMGIVLKRRDNAPCVKDCYGGIVDILMKQKDVVASIKFLKKYLQDMVSEKIKLDKLIISKSLKSLTSYKNPDQIAHSVLAERMGKRDPGSKPSTGSRIPYIYIQTTGKVKLQGDRIEHPDYVRKMNLKPDYTHYITNQLQKPIQQIYGLVLDQIPEFKPKVSAHKRIINSIKRRYKEDVKKQREKIEKECNKHVKALLFQQSLRLAKNKKNNQKTLFSAWNL
jgi:DNA polymerase elongation subunit (family B)